MDKTSVVVHESKLYECEPYSVECMAIDEKQGILAVARRADFGEERKRESLLEFWNVISKPAFHIKTRRLGFGGVEALLWVDSVLLSAHLDGSIVAHHLHRPLSQKTQVCPSPLWSLSPLRGHAFCAGSDSGSIFFLLLDGGKVSIEKTISIGFGLRVLSLASNGKVVAAGSLDTISIVDADKAKILHTLKLPRAEKRKPTIVWCLDFIEDVLVSGDSRGCVSFWNVSNGALFQSIESHQADVLTLCVADGFVHASGVDPSIMRFRQNQGRTGFRIDHSWRHHSNDVRALVYSKNNLYSGGAQHEFYISTPAKYEAAVKPPICIYLPKKNFVSYQYAKYVIIWMLGSTKGNANKKGDFTIGEEPVKLAKIGATENEYIISSAINQDSSLLAISTRSSLSLYQTSLNEIDQSNVSKSEITVKKISEFDVSASAMVFENSMLYYTSGSLNLCCIDSQQPDITTTKISREDSGEAIKISVNCRNDSYRAALLTTRNELLYKGSNSDDFCRLELGKIQAPLMDVQFADEESLFILCASRECAVFECSPEDKSGNLRGKNLAVQQLAPGKKSNEVFMLAKDDYLQSMHLASWGASFVSAYGAIRLLVSIDGKRAVLHSDETRSRETKEAEKACAIQWIGDGTVLLTSMSAPTEPTQGAFRVKRFKQN